jgi:hypothetical protein
MSYRNSRGTMSTASRLMPFLSFCLVVAACAVSQEGDLRNGDPCTQGFVDEQMLEKALRDANVCCNDFQSMQFIAPRGHVVMTVGKQAPVFSFNTGKSRFIALDLTAYDKNTASLIPMSTTAMSAPPDYTCGKGIEQVRPRAFRPIVQWLDSKKNTLRGPDRGAPTVVRGAAGWVFQRPPGAQYMIVYSQPADYGELLSLNAPAAGLLFKTDTVGLAASVHPQRILGPVTYAATSTGHFQFLLTEP